MNLAFLTRSPTTTACGWKGTARYYSIEVEGARNADAAWYYPDPKPAAKNIRDHVAFWRESPMRPEPGALSGRARGLAPRGAQ